jgi:SAM-dependent methyltransferase
MEPVFSHLDAIRTSYDTVERWALGRGFLAAFAEEVGSGRAVADVGCGPGHVTAVLREHGADAFGVDLSPRMVEIARRTYPGVRFEVGSMTALDLPDGVLGGIVAYWSIFHLPPAELPGVFAEFARTLAPGGQLLVGFHVGDGRLTPERAYGHPVTYESWLLRPEQVTAHLAAAGLTVTAQLLSEGRKYPQSLLWARKTATSPGRDSG